MSTNIVQLRRLVLIGVKKDAEGKLTKEALEITENELGQDTLMTVNIAPRMMTRSSQVGTTERPIPGTFDAFAASITFIMDNFAILGKAIRNWVAATYPGATASEGQITDENRSYCAGDSPLQVIAQGICDDGSAADIELTRCYPSVDDDLEIGGSDAPEVTLNLHPQIYNPNTHKDDGFPARSYRFGVENTAQKTRLDATTGEYVPATTTTPTTPEETA